MLSSSISPKVVHTHICRDYNPHWEYPCITHVFLSFLETGLCELEFQVWRLPSYHLVLQRLWYQVHILTVLFYTVLGYLKSRLLFYISIIQCLHIMYMYIHCVFIILLVSLLILNNDLSLTIFCSNWEWMLAQCYLWLGMS